MARTGRVILCLGAGALALGMAARDPVRGGAKAPERPIRRPTAPSAALAEATFVGRAAPGLEVSLRAEPRTDAPLAVRWVQAGGPPIALDDPASLAPRFIVPADAGLIEMVLFVGDGHRVETTRLTIPVEGPYAAGLKADAGDDQRAWVGHRVTLNGLRSEPHGQIGYRWIQVGGPIAALAVEDGAVYSFVPAAPGEYRFALVVASAGVISAPDRVMVAVEEPANTAPAGAPPAPEQVPVAASRPTTLAESVAVLPGGSGQSRALADAFTATADRVDLYATYEELHSELSRRLEPALPADPTARQVWEARLFAPLSAPLAAAARREGLDLAQPEGWRAAMPDGLRREIERHFRTIAAGLRAAGSDHEATDPAQPATADTEDDR